MKHFKRFFGILGAIVAIYTVLGVVGWITGEFTSYLYHSGFSLLQTILILFGGLSIIFSALMTYLWD